MLNLVQKTYIQIAGLLHDLIDKLSDAGRTAKHALRDLQKQIGQAEESVADVQAELLLMKSEAAKAIGKAEKWGRVAETTANAGDNIAAIEAVQQQVLAEEAAANYGRNAARLSPMLDQMKARLSDLRQKLLEKQHKATMLDARSKVADAQARAARSLGNIGSKPGIDFDQLEQQVDRKEAKAASLADLAEDKATLDVESRLAGYSRRDAIGIKLEALGIPPAVSTQLLVPQGA